MGRAVTPLWMGGLVLLAAAFAAATNRGLQPERSRAARGEEVARAAGCFACHGPGAVRGITDPSLPGARVPSWDGRELATLAKDLGELREWIADGHPQRLAPAGGSAVERFIPMPAYRKRLTADELDAVLAYVVAVSGFDPGIGDAAYEGRVLAEKLGCFGCHGPSGMGGLGNPGSFKGYIPAWDGADFGELVRSDQELDEWILDGRPRRLWENPLARRFLERQLIQMPAYRRFLSDDQLGKLRAYINHLRPRPPAALPSPSPAPAAGPAAPASPAGGAASALPAGAVLEREAEPEPPYRSPIALALTADGARLLAVNQTSGTLSIVDAPGRRLLGELPLCAFPSAAALSPDGKTLFASCQHEDRVVEVDLAAQKVTRHLTTGHEPHGLALSRDGRRLFVANYLSDSVSALDLSSGAELARLPVGRGPRFLALSHDGARLLASNGLGRSLTVLDAEKLAPVEARELGRASILREVALTPDGRFGVVAHVLSRDAQIPQQMERGWIHSNGLSLVDLGRPGWTATLLLDRLLAGAANPYGLALSKDGRRAFVSLAGVHEVALVDLEGAQRLLSPLSAEQRNLAEQDVELAEKKGLARRVPSGGLGPRGLALDERRGELWVAHYFSDELTALDAATGAVRARVSLGPPLALSLRRRGELLFNDARITYQTWFSCVSCHEEDAGMDALNWDLPNDGTGNSKNVKSLRDAHDTPPSMWAGVRVDMGAAIQAGQRFQGFLPEAENQRALAAYLGAPARPPNPFRRVAPEVLSRGAAAFRRARCDTCHPAPRFTDLKKHDLNLGAPQDLLSRFDTPSLREVYRSGPWLHDGRAATLESIFAEHDPLGLHGRVGELTAKEREDLLAYVRSL